MNQSKQYQQALKEFYELQTVIDDNLDGTIKHLVFQAQHEIDLEDKGDNNYIGLILPKSEYVKLKKFVKKWGNK